MPFSSTIIIAREFNPVNGPLTISNPFVLPNEPSLKSERVTTLSNPSAPQKRFWAKGKSRETHRIV